MNLLCIFFCVLLALAIPPYGISKGSNEESDPPQYLRNVDIRLGKYQHNNQWYVVCSLSDAQKQRSFFQFALKSIRVESCHNLGSCYLAKEKDTDRTTKDCSAGANIQCVFDKLDASTSVTTSTLRVHGKVICSVEINSKIYETYDYYFRGRSYKYYLTSSQFPLEEMLGIEVKKSEKYIKQREVACTALLFLFKPDSLTLTLSYTNGNSRTIQEVQPWSNNEIKSWTHSFEGELTRDISAITCSVLSINSNSWISTTFTVREEDRPDRASIQEHVTIKTKITKTTTSTTSHTKSTIPTKPSISSRSLAPATGSPSRPPITSHSTDTEEVLGQKPTIRTETLPMHTSHPSGSDDTKNTPSVEESNQSFTIIVASMGLALLVVFLLTGYCVHRYFTIVWLCCRHKSPSKLESHELKPMKSVVAKFSIPSKYMISSKDLSVDYNQIVSQGEFSTLYQGHLKQSRKHSVLVKVNKIGRDAGEIASLMNDVQMRILAGETNESIAAILGAYFDRTAGKVYIAMQSAPQRSMREFLTNKNMPMGQMKILNLPSHEMIDTFCRWLKGVSYGLEFLHSKKIVHGNPAAENILVSLQNTSSVSITGFSHSQQLIGNSSYFVKSRGWRTGWETSGWRWMPMESLRYMEFSKESDVWSFGVLMWEIFSLGAIPYSKFRYLDLSMAFIQKLEFGIRLSQPQLAPRKIYRTMEACWSRYGKDRPKASQLCGYFNEDQSNLINYVNLVK